MTGQQPTERRVTSDSWGRRALRRLLSGRADPADCLVRRAGVDPAPAVLVPRLWVALA